MRKQLRAAFETKTWGNSKVGRPRSGSGSSLEMTARLRANLPRIFDQYNIKTFLDAPCGDWFWMQHVDLTGINYIGGDISSEVVAENVTKLHRPELRFMHLDITGDPLPKADMMMCRDCLMHLKPRLKWRFLENFVASQTPFLMTTVHHVLVNRVVKANGDFRRFNPMMAPFNFAPPLELIPETAETLDADILENRLNAPEHRSVGIWGREQVIAAISNRPAITPSIADPTD